MSLITVVLAFAVRAFGSCGPQVCLTFRVIEFHEDTPAPDKHSQTNHAHARIDKKWNHTQNFKKEIKSSAWPQWGQDADIGPSHIWKHLALFRESKAPTHLEKTASNTELSYWKLCLWCVLHFHSPQNAMYVILMSTNLSAFERMVWEYLLKLNLWSIFNDIIL